MSKVRGVQVMYNDGPSVIGVVAPVVTTAGVAVLPNTGSDMLVQLAVAAAAGLVTWGVLYVRGAYNG